MDDEGLVKLIPHSLFSTLDNTILPTNWVITSKKNKVVLQPREWGSEYVGVHSFWEDYYDNKKSALKAFDIGRKRG